MNKITKFDLESAFKALDEIALPKTLSNRRNIVRENCSKLTPNTDVLFEDYYNVNSQEDLLQAKAAQDEEVAKAKLAKIEQIVDLDADTPEDLQPSYVGKDIIQCPRCQTLFYKDPADIVASDEDPTIVNKGEVCQHCGNEDGYNLIGKVAEADVAEEESIPAEDTDETEDEFPEPVEDVEETPEEEEPSKENADLEELPELPDLNEPEEEEIEDKDKKEANESYKPLNEANINYNVSDSELDALFNSPEFKKKITDSEVRHILASESVNKKLDNVEELDEESVNKCITESLKSVYENVKSFTLTEAVHNTTTNSLVINGTITFNSGRTKNTQYVFTEAINKDNKIIFEGKNSGLAKNGCFFLAAATNKNKLITESFGHHYRVMDGTGTTLVEGLARR